MGEPHGVERVPDLAPSEVAEQPVVAEGDFLRHPEDPRDAKVFRPQVPTDEFVLKYQKP